MRPRLLRQKEVERLRAHLELTGFPRLMMAFLVGLTGGAGFLVSYGLLNCCVTSMAVRYPVAIAIAYLVFLLLLWLWLRTSAEDYSEIPDFSGLNINCHDRSSGCGDCSSGAPDDCGSASGAFDAAADADGLAVLLIVIVVAGTVLLSSLWIVYIAPGLFAELLVDGVLSASLYRRLRGLETQHWLTTAINRTLWPFVLSAFIAGIGGAALQAHYPSAKSLGEVWRMHGQGRG